MNCRCPQWSWWSVRRLICFVLISLKASQIYSDQVFHSSSWLGASGGGRFLNSDSSAQKYAFLNVANFLPFENPFLRKRSKERTIIPYTPVKSTGGRYFWNKFCRTMHWSTRLCHLEFLPMIPNELIRGRASLSMISWPWWVPKMTLSFCLWVVRCDDMSIQEPAGSSYHR